MTPGSSADPVALPPGAHRWTEAERQLAAAVLAGRTVVVNVRRGGPHRHLVPWLVEEGLLTYVGHAGPRHTWPESDFANPFLALRADRDAMVTRYRDWILTNEPLRARLRDGELTGRALGCWCAPQRCHADVLADLADHPPTLDNRGPTTR
ncbi:DUF4326 domain-containing protein [Actinophytocola xanthii]|uniref:DUF4326 domain-containing protein n=1 Tax=Actinophytocola xanthii TaxID=1912961 RepID=A0A1Q8C3G5_9PSEU|nr:DUF4326 domain-containing protein [Actinophytocola xanthii]OLF08901.1 hypothetical protein BU204_33790 [Actinophytocola xanthii]